MNLGDEVKKNSAYVDSNPQKKFWFITTKNQGL